MPNLLKSLHGIVPPLITPLKDDGALDTAGVEKVVEHLVSGGVHGLFALGTTGEFASLSERLKREMVSATAKALAGRLPLLVGVTHTSYAETLSLAKDAAALGADALVLSTPYYFQLSQDELWTYLSRIISELPLPVFLYNIPSCTKVNIEPDTVMRTLDLPNVAGFKDSSGNVNYFHQIVALNKAHGNKALFMGPEELLADSVLLGGQGGVCGGANLCPKLYVSLYQAAARGDLPAVQVLHEQVIRISTTLYKVGAYGSSFVKSLKCSMKLIGLCNDALAMPFDRFSPEEKEKVQTCLQTLGISVVTPWPQGCSF